MILLRRPTVDGKIILKQMLKKQDGSEWTGLMQVRTTGWILFSR